MFHLEFPNISHKSRYLDMIKECGDFETIPTNPSRLFAGENYTEFLDIITTDLTQSSRGVNGTLFFFMDDSEILGAIQVRHNIEHPGMSYDVGCGGHIGYGLRPSARGQGLAKEMLKLGMIETKKLGIRKMLISAYEDNPPSWRTIESCGGIHDKTIDKDERKLKVYWINL